MAKYDIMEKDLQILSHPGDALLRLVTETIETVHLTDDQLALVFSGGSYVRIMDSAQNCCERRYITTDDDINSLIGGRLMCIKYREAASIIDENADVHEAAFVDVCTSNGTITLCTHNEHNGYYGGFGIEVEITNSNDNNQEVD